MKGFETKRSDQYLQFQSVHFTSENEQYSVEMDTNTFSSYIKDGDLRCRIEMVIFGDHIQWSSPTATSSPTETLRIDDVDNLLADFEKLINDEASSDVVIKCGDKSFHAHKLILSARSPVFAAMFRHGTQECNMDEFEPEVVSFLLIYIYTGKQDELSDEQMTSVVQAADKYGLLRLKDYYMELLRTRITKENFTSIAILSSLHGGGDLMKRNLKAFYFRNGAALRSSDEFRRMVKQYPDSLHELE